MTATNLFTIIIFIYLTIFPRIVSADVMLNEFAVDSSPQQVELYNSGTDAKDISGWYIDDNGGTTYFTIPDGTNLLPNACIVFSGEFNLNKSSADSIRLFDHTAPPTSTESHLLDSFSYSKGPGAGNSFARLPDGTGDWQTVSSSFGSLDSNGSSCIVIPSPTATPTPTSVPTSAPTSAPTETTTPASISYNNIFINEVLAYPESGDLEKVELLNLNNFSVTLTNWFIDDGENTGAAPKQFSLTIPAGGVSVYQLSTGMFNNDGDTVRLLDSNKIVKDSFEYSSSVRGESWGRVSTESDTFCQQAPSFGSSNNSCITNSPTPTPSTILIQTVKTTLTPTVITSSFKKMSTENRSNSIEKKSPMLTTNSNEKSPQDLYNQDISDGESLGKSSVSHSAKLNTWALVKSTLFTTSSYSILAAISLLRKIKESL